MGVMRSHFNFLLFFNILINLKAATHPQKSDSETSRPFFERNW